MYNYCIITFNISVINAQHKLLYMSKLSHSLKHTASKVLHRYADYRIGATTAEKRCHKRSDSILLTFDDYGTAEEVHDIVRILREKGAKGMFFLQGDWANDHPLLVKEIAAAGHIIGNHTLTHKVLRGEPERVIRREITSGLPGPWFRPPQGRYDKRIRSIAGSMGYEICYWTIDSRDWTGVGTEEMRHTVLTELHPGAVILFHLHGRHTRELLPSLINDIRTLGYMLTPTSESWDAPKH